MDYKKASETLAWHSVHTKMNGTEARVLIRMLVSAQVWKDDTFSESHQEMAHVLGVAKIGVQKAIDRLVAAKAITIRQRASGRAPAVYKVRSVDDLNGIYLETTTNPEYWQWIANRRAAHGDMVDQIKSVGKDCKECQNSENGKFCPDHTDEIDDLKGSLEGREYSLWLSDNPPPPQNISTIKGRPV